MVDVNTQYIGKNVIFRNNTLMTDGSVLAFKINQVKYIFLILKIKSILNNCTIENNFATKNSGISSIGTPLLIQNCKFIDNTGNLSTVGIFSMFCLQNIGV